MEYNFGNGAIRWPIPKCIKDLSRIFAISLTVNEILTFEIIFDLRKEGQGH